MFKDCGGPSKEPYKPVTESFTYTLDADSGNTALRLTKLGCAPGSAAPHAAAAEVGDAGDGASDGETGAGAGDAAANAGADSGDGG